MTSFLTIINMISVIASTKTQAISFATVLNHASAEDISIAELNNIDDWNDYAEYMMTQASRKKDWSFLS